jgi:hypothetical protein
MQKSSLIALSSAMVFGLGAAGVVGLTQAHAQTPPSTTPSAITTPTLTPSETPGTETTDPATNDADGANGHQDPNGAEVTD